MIGGVPSILFNKEWANNFSKHMFFNVSIVKKRYSTNKLQLFPYSKVLGDKSKAANYRSISLTSVIMKNFRENYEKTNVLLFIRTWRYDAQHGLIKRCFCLSSLRSVFNTIFKYLSGDKATCGDMIYIDYAKAIFNSAVFA